MPVTLCTLGVGATFGESILNTLPRDTTVLTRTTCELLRVERRDFKAIWEKNKELMDQFVASCKVKNGYAGTGAGTPGTPGTPTSPATTPLPSRKSASPVDPDPAKPITDAPGAQAARVGWVLRHLLVSGSCPESLRGAMSPGGNLIFTRGRRHWTGSDLVDWMIEASEGAVRSRQQACAMWQSLLEEGVLVHMAGELPFLDTDAFYRFFMDPPPAGGPMPTAKELEAAEDDLHDAVGVLNTRAPHATLRYILRKPPGERSEEDLETVYDELVRIKALSHLSNSVRRELASVIVFESHPRAGTVLFQQGDEGHSWYIILRGSVDVEIHGKGVVTTLAEGDDFGKLALLNDAPRAASIILRENNCHFLRVDKDHFNRIVRDVEANVVRLKEHGQDVLVLEKISNTHSHFKYTVMAGTSQKMLEHLLETRLDGRAGSSGRDDHLASDPFLEDFLLTHIVFMPTQQLVTELNRHYHIESPSQDREFLLGCKRRVVQFVHCWVHTVRHPVFDDPDSLAFLEELAGQVEADAMTHPSLQEEASLMHHVMSQLRRYQEDRAAAAGQKWKLPPCGQPVAPFSPTSPTRGRAVIRPTDDIIFRVYCADHTYCTLRCPVSTTAEQIKSSAADKLKLNKPAEDLVLVEVKSSGERVVIPDNDLSVPTGLSGLNARLFVASRDHIDALTPLPEQEGPTEAIYMDLDLFSTKELAHHMTLFDWDLFWSVHEYELLYKTFGRHNFGQITANLDVFLRRFNEIQYWVITEVCLATQLSKRVSILRKMIKLAQYCRNDKNLNALFAIVMGLGNVAVSRLSLTWEKLPSKSRKLFTELEALIDPTRNHRAYRIAVGRLQPPIIPFMPLLIKDMTFTHEGNKTFQDGLVNFEKMHMLAQTMRSIRHCRSRHLVLEPLSPKSEADVREHIGALRVIDNTRMLNSLSQKLEPRRS